MDPLYQRLQQMITAWQAKDIDKVLTFLHEDLVWHYAAGPMPPVRGKATAAKLLGRFTADMHAIQWRIFAHAESGDRLFVEGVDEYTSADGKRIAAPYAGVLEFKDGLIIGWRDYVDIGVIAAQKAGEPITAHVEALLDRRTS
jgi:limonene-1,2-epoxide hydrolase